MAFRLHATNPAFASLTRTKTLFSDKSLSIFHIFHWGKRGRGGRFEHGIFKETRLGPLFLHPFGPLTPADPSFRSRGLIQPTTVNVYERRGGVFRRLFPALEQGSNLFQEQGPPGLRVPFRRELEREGQARKRISRKALWKAKGRRCRR